MDFLLVGIIGLVIGSFLNVCIYRVPLEESISYPPSHCASCNHRLYPKDLVPLFSYMFLRGRCRYCGERISLRYPLIESLNAVLFLVIYAQYGLTLDMIKYCFLTSLLIVIAVIDYNTKDVYNSTIILGIVVGIVFITTDVIINDVSPVSNVLGFTIGFMAIGIIVFLTRGMGQGDIGIAAVCGLFLGNKLILVNLFIAIVIGGMIGVIILAFKMKNKKDSMAFGPCLASGAVISILFGNIILNKYFELFF